MVFHSLGYCVSSNNDDSEENGAEQRRGSIEIMNPMKNNVHFNAGSEEGNFHHHHPQHLAKGHNRPLYCDSPEIQNMHNKLDDVIRMISQIDIMKKGKFQKIR